MTEPATAAASATQRLLGFGLLLLAGLLLHLLGPILTPFLVALALAYLWDPAVDRLERAGLGRAVAVSLVFLVMSLLIVLLVLVLVPLLGRQMHVMAAKVPLPGDKPINVTTEFEYFLPVREGDVMNMTDTLVSISEEKTTKIGTGHFITAVGEYRNQRGELVARSTNVLFRYRAV